MQVHNIQFQISERKCTDLLYEHIANVLFLGQKFKPNQNFSHYSNELIFWKIFYSSYSLDLNLLYSL